MEKIVEDALRVQNYLPWVENEEEIINFMRKIPIDKSYLRIPITIKFFLNRKDSTLVLPEQIEDDARDLITILPTLPYQEIKKQMQLLGNIHNRKEIILRMFLHGNEDIDDVLNEMRSRKRSIPQQSDLFEISKKLRQIDDHIVEVLNGKKNNSEFENSVVISYKGQETDLQSFRSTLFGPPLAVQVPGVFHLNQKIREKGYDPALQEFIKNVSNDTFISPASTSVAAEPVRQEIIENNTVTITEENLPILNLAKAGPSKENPIDEATIDLQEHQVPISKKSRNIDEKLVSRLIEIFPETCPDYIRDISVDKNWLDFDNLVTIIIENEDHPKRQKAVTPKGVNPEDKFEIVKALLPDADPTYLGMMCEMLEYKPDDLNEFVIQAEEKKDYPTMKDYIRNQQITAQSKQYTTEFSTEQFVQLFPEPHITFNDSKRVIDLDNYSKMYITQYFHNKFDKLPKRAIYNILQDNNFKILQTNERLLFIQNSSLTMKTRRKQILLNNNINNIPVLQEIAYLEHKDEIESFIRTIKEKKKKDLQYAKDNGLIKTCQCCFNDEVMPKDTFFCPRECIFCKDCIRQSCEIAYGEGRTNFKCLNNCPEEFSLQTLQSILMPKMFSKIAQKKMIEEIKAAGIEDLEMCPFCDFASIPNEQDKIFKCLNPDCMKESCRNCKEPNHIPLHCDEIEKDENVKARVFIENKMTEALLCKCWKCGTSFFKEEGCNKMTCTCGAQMCYVCKKPVKDYTHFNGMGGNKYHLCPLYSDSVHLNQENVLTAVEQAKTEIDPSMLKIDPSENLQQYYRNRRKSLPQHLRTNFPQNFPGHWDHQFPHVSQQDLYAQRHYCMLWGRRRHRHDKKFSY